MTEEKERRERFDSIFPESHIERKSNMRKHQPWTDQGRDVN